MLTLTNRSTQKKVTDSERELYLRNDQDIYQLITFVLKGNADIKPVMTGKSGFFSQTDNAKSIFDEVMAVQKFFKKTDGIRMREKYINFSRDELTEGAEVEQLERIASLMSQFYLFKGFQNVWSVVSRGEEFTIYLVINTVSCFDGSKYHYNKADVDDDEFAYLLNIYNLVVNNDFSVNIDYTPLEFYPYSF